LFFFSDFRRNFVGKTGEEDDSEVELDFDLVQDFQIDQDNELQPIRIHIVEDFEIMDSDSSYSIEENEGEAGDSDFVVESDSDSEDSKPKETQETAGESSKETVERRAIDDYDENEEDDEVIKKILKELKKPRSKPPDITTEEYVVDLSFHPDRNILAVGNITGDIIIYEYGNEENKLLYTHEVHTKAIRDIEFSIDGKDLISASRDKSIMVTDFETGKLKRFWDKAHEEPVYKLSVIDENLFATGDDNGTVKMWDLRLKATEPVFSLKLVEDFISSIITNAQKKLLCCTSSDGFLSTINITAKYGFEIWADFIVNF
jgi:WD40 repeat protein